MQDPMYYIRKTNTETDSILNELQQTYKEPVSGIRYHMKHKKVIIIEILDQIVLKSDSSFHQIVVFSTVKKMLKSHKKYYNTGLY